MIILDLDNTLINIDSDYEWVLFNNKINNKNTFFKTINIFFKKYNISKLNIEKYNKFIFKNNFFFKNCKIIYIIFFFLKKIINNKINNKTLFILFKIKIINKIIINTSTNKNISKLLNYYLNIKKTYQTNNKIKKINFKLNYNNITYGINNYKAKKIKNFFHKKKLNIKKFFFSSDSINDIIWKKKKINSINPDRLLFNNFISNKKKIIFKKNIKKLFF